jgi:cytochrome b561
MTEQLQYGATAKGFHWLVVGLLIPQYAIGWLMPDIHRGEVPGRPMMLHISIGIVILICIVLRLLWRVTHAVAPDNSLPSWQRLSSRAVHELLYLFVFATTISGWFYASMRGWSIALFGVVKLPMLTETGSTFARSVGRLHETLEWGLLILTGVHVFAALVHHFVYRDRIIWRMLPD